MSFHSVLYHLSDDALHKTINYYDHEIKAVKVAVKNVIFNIKYKNIM